MISDEFARRLLDVAKRDLPAPGAHARAMAALEAGVVAGASTIVLKLLSMILLAGAIGVVAWRLARAETSGSSVRTAHDETLRHESPAVAMPPSVREPTVERAIQPLPPTVSRHSIAVPPPPRDEKIPRLPPARPGKPCSTWGRPVRMVLENKQPAAIDLYWINYECEEELASNGHILGGATYRGISYDTHPFRVRDPVSHRLIKDISPMSSDPDTTRIFIDESQSPSDGTATVCSTKPHKDIVFQFVNARKSAIEAFWVDDLCEEVSYGTIAPGDQHEQVTYDTHGWRFRDASTHKLVYELPPQPLAEWKITVP